MAWYACQPTFGRWLVATVSRIYARRFNSMNEALMQNESRVLPRFSRGAKSGENLWSVAHESSL